MSNEFIPSIAIESNVVSKESLRKVQLNILKQLRSIMAHTFGPAGSNTLMIRGNSSRDIVSEYSKDGHTVLKSILYSHPIEMSIQSELTNITRYVERQVGDGTTSAVELSSFIFEALCNMEDSNNPYQMMRDFHKAVDNIKARIKLKSRDITVDDIYNISLISTNGNTDIAENMKNIYEECGFDVYMDVKASTDENTYQKSYDGLTFNQGYSSTAYINTLDGNSYIKGARIYAFLDPIDTMEMITLMNQIIRDNIYSPMELGQRPIPTLIMAPKISRDAREYIADLESALQNFDRQKMIEVKPPICIVTNFGTGLEMDQYMDICTLCGTPMIHKYIDPKIQEEDVKNGKAPSVETISENFYGTADVEINESTAKFMNPGSMYDEEGNPTELLESHLGFLKSQLKNATETGGDANTIGNLKRRINSLNSNMVDYFVGGVSISDRDSLRALVEDAVLNCRSAAANGVGYAANFEGYRAVKELKSETDENDKLYKYYSIIMSAYREVSVLLYSTMQFNDTPDTIISKAFENGCPLNLATGEYDHKVLCSINTDVIILDAISRIVTIMFTANQALVQSPSLNLY